VLFRSGKYPEIFSAYRLQEIFWVAAHMKNDNSFLNPRIAIFLLQKFSRTISDHGFNYFWDKLVRMKKPTSVSEKSSNMSCNEILKAVLAMEKKDTHSFDGFMITEEMKDTFLRDNSDSQALLTLYWDRCEKENSSDSKGNTKPYHISSFKILSERTDPAGLAVMKALKEKYSSEEQAKIFKEIKTYREEITRPEQEVEKKIQEFENAWNKASAINPQTQHLVDRDTILELIEKYLPKGKKNSIISKTMIQNLFENTVTLRSDSFMLIDPSICYLLLKEHAQLLSLDLIKILWKNLIDVNMDKLSPELLKEFSSGPSLYEILMASFDARSLSPEDIERVIKVYWRKGQNLNTLIYLDHHWGDKYRLFYDEEFWKREDETGVRMQEYLRIGVNRADTEEERTFLKNHPRDPNDYEIVKIDLLKKFKKHTIYELTKEEKRQFFVCFQDIVEKLYNTGALTWENKPMTHEDVVASLQTLSGELGLLVGQKP
jgi:hypothetical protein